MGAERASAPAFMTHPDAACYLYAQQIWEQAQRGEVRLTEQQAEGVQAMRAAAPAALDALADAMRKLHQRAQ
ncbi:hypothetical protein ABPG75_000576 [Micractinium tetrahymenae]